MEGTNMAKVSREFTTVGSLEKKMENEDLKRDFAVLNKVSTSLPSEAKIKIYKKDDDNVAYIATISAEDFSTQDPHQYILTKYAKKHGGGDYIVELLDSDGNAVKRTMVSIAGDSAKYENPTKEARIVEEALNMREEAYTKMKEAQGEKLEAEKTKFETVIGSMEKQWETIQQMYQAQIEALKDQMSGAPDPTAQMMIQMQMDKIGRDFEMSRSKMENEMKNQGESKVATEKMYDLVNTLIPMVINNKPEIKDPVEELTKMLNVVSIITGGKKDMIESFIESPEKAIIFKRLLGVEDNIPKKDFLSDMIESPEKAIIFKRLLGVEESSKKKDFFEDMIENPMKAQMFKTMLGLDKKDFFTEISENPQKFDFLKKIMGLDELEAMKSLPPPVVTERKDPLDQFVDMFDKVNKLKTLIAPPPPARSGFEFLGNLFSAIAPNINNLAAQVMQGLITIEMVKKGNVNPEALMALSAGQPVVPPAHVPYVEESGKNQLSEEQKRAAAAQNRTTRVAEETADPFGQISTKPKESGMGNGNVEREFQTILIDVVSSFSEPPEMDVFVDKVVGLVYKKVLEKPGLAFEAMGKYRDMDTAKLKLSEILTATTGINGEQVQILATAMMQKGEIVFKEHLAA
jgi:hypothetical protein